MGSAASSPAGARVQHMLLVDLLPGSERALPSANPNGGRRLLPAAEALYPPIRHSRPCGHVFAHDPVGFGAIENPEVEPLDLSGVDP